MLLEAEYNNRLDIQQLREFLLHGTELPKTETGDYDMRIKNAQKSLRKFMDNNFPDNSEDEIMEYILDYASDMQDIYFEMGMQSGACIIVQLLKNILTAK